MTERRVFDALRTRLTHRRYGYRQLFWITGIVAFFLSPLIDNLTTALVLCAVVLAVGKGNPKFIGVACINIVVAANTGGAFSPFGDITTLMVWQSGLFCLIYPCSCQFPGAGNYYVFNAASKVPSRGRRTCRRQTWRENHRRAVRVYGRYGRLLS